MPLLDSGFLKPTPTTTHFPSTQAYRVLLCGTRPGVINYTVTPNHTVILNPFTRLSHIPPFNTYFTVADIKDAFVLKHYPRP